MGFGIHRNRILSFLTYRVQYRTYVCDDNRIATVIYSLQPLIRVTTC
jgi:hypothetical protein